MPRIRILLESQRRKSVGDDLVRVFEFRAPGISYTGYDLPADDPKFAFNPPPHRYICEMLITGFHTFRHEVPIAVPPKPGLLEISLRLRHRCVVLPAWAQLSAWQRSLLDTLDASTSGREAWEESLSDNQCATFFQVTAAVERTPMGPGCSLSDYIERVFRIGGAEIVGQRKKGGREFRKTGWRMHIQIPETLQGTIAADLAAHGFRNDSNSAHHTHAAFGFRRSYRQQGPNPRLQIVLDRPERNSERATAADVDLDNGVFHLSSPMDVRDPLVARFPELAPIYQLG